MIEGTRMMLHLAGFRTMHLFAEFPNKALGEASVRVSSLFCSHALLSGVFCWVLDSVGAGQANFSHRRSRESPETNFCPGLRKRLRREQLPSGGIGEDLVADSFTGLATLQDTGVSEPLRCGTAYTGILRSVVFPLLKGDIRMFSHICG